MGVVAGWVKDVMSKRAIHESRSLLVGGIFLFVTFGNETSPDIEIKQVHIAYIVFLVTTGIGIVLLLLLRTPKRSKQ